MSENKTKKQFQLVIPLDASEIEGFKPDQAIKVAVKSPEGSITVQTVKLKRNGKGTATFVFEKKPRGLNVAVGPESASDEELFGMQTLCFNVSVRQWVNERILNIPSVKISPYYWYWWLHRCRAFTIRGKVICPDGNPVPGAEVCVYDTDYWWWWSSKQLVGCATTDATGSFEIKFRWCCGWWPWWWWRYRIWQLEPVLADRILAILRDLKLRRVPIPRPKPSLTIFKHILEGDDTITSEERLILTRAEMSKGQPAIQDIQSLQRTIVDQSVLEKLRVKLKDRMPVIPEFEQLHLWPWYPWYPWWDCTPDITFQVKQNCLGVEKVIVDENLSDTRWNIPTTLNVTLVAEDACCIEPQDYAVGECLLITHACDDPVQSIGGNPTAPPTPAGYKNPGVISIYGDRPYAGVVPISGLFGDLANVDYYEFEWSDDGGSTWNPMPPAAAGGFTRVYWGHALDGVGPLGFHAVHFPFINKDGRRVIESREHFEANHAPASWGMSRFWASNRNKLMRWITTNIFDDKTYKLHVKSWNLDAGGKLINPKILPLCNTTEDNRIVLTIDNQFTTSGPTCPNGHLCGSGTVHACTAQPDTDIIEVKIIHADNTETFVGACGNVSINDTDKLQVDFMAHDPDGHLSYYSLHATYGENKVRNLLHPSFLNQPGCGLTALTGALVPPASQVGPYYGHSNTDLSALDQGAVSPIWHGGALRLLIPAKLAFPRTCCYQLELRAYKRTIVNCVENLLIGHRNLSEYSFMIVV